MSLTLFTRLSMNDLNSSRSGGNRDGGAFGLAMKSGGESADEPRINARFVESMPQFVASVVQKACPAMSRDRAGSAGGRRFGGAGKWSRPAKLTRWCSPSRRAAADSTSRVVARNRPVNLRQSKVVLSCVRRCSHNSACRSQSRKDGSTSRSNAPSLPEDVSRVVQQEQVLRQRKPRQHSLARRAKGSLRHFINQLRLCSRSRVLEASQRSQVDRCKWLSRIEKPATEKVSAMPEGLTSNLTPEQLADLIAYLQSLN